MSSADGPREFELEKRAIDAGYHDHIKELFRSYYFGVVAAKVDDQKAKAALATFKQRLEDLQRTHTRAISIFSDHDKM